MPFALVFGLWDSGDGLGIGLRGIVFFSFNELFPVGLFVACLFILIRIVKTATVLFLFACQRNLYDGLYSMQIEKKKKKRNAFLGH